MDDVVEVTRSANTWKKLERLLDDIEDGSEAKPDWIDLKDKADLGRLAEADLTALVRRMHASVLRGFRANDVRLSGRQRRLDHWRAIARNGFHDFAEKRWMKCFDSPYVEDYDYVGPYLEGGGLDALDPYMVYSSVLGTWEYSVEDFVHTDLLQDVTTIVEPLAGSAEFSHAGHFQYPDFRYVMFDLDEEAKRHVEARPWLPQTKREFIVGDALVESTWAAVRAASIGTSLAYIGKQSHNFFGPRDLMKVLEWGTRHCDHLMLEVSEPYLLDSEPTIDELTRPEHKAAGFRVALDDLEDKPSNPLTNAIDFYLIAWDKLERRNLFSYCGWTGYQAPTLSALGRLLDLEVRYFHSDQTEFVSVDVDTETSDCRDNNTFLLFSRR